VQGGEWSKVKVARNKLYRHGEGDAELYKLLYVVEDPPSTGQGRETGRRVSILFRRKRKGGRKGGNSRKGKRNGEHKGILYLPKGNGEGKIVLSVIFPGGKKRASS